MEISTATLWSTHIWSVKLQSFENKKNRTEIVQNIINLKNFNSYLEIGTFKDELFNFVNCKTKIGVDPAYGGNVRKTSDQFFKEN